MKRIAWSRLPELLAAMATRGSLYCPLEDGAGHSRFARWEPGKEPVLTGNTRLGPKDLFFPQVEDLMRFRVSGKELEILEARVRQEPFVVFGVRPCDCRALEILDRVFMAPSSAWLARSRRRPAFAGPLALTLGTRQGMCPPGSGRTPCTSGPIRKRERRCWRASPWRRGRSLPWRQHRSEPGPF